MTKILVPLDGSERSQVAVQLGIGWAKSRGAELVFLGSWADAAEREQDKGRALAQSLEAAEVQARQALDAVRVVERLGEPVEAIVAELEPGDTVVMTSHGRSDLKRFLFGSVALEVVRRAPCPVLLVGPQVSAEKLSKDPPFSRIMVCLDGSEVGATVLPRALEMANVVKGDLLLVSAQAVPPGSDGLPTESSAARAERVAVQEYLDGQVRRIKGSGRPISTHLVAGLAAPTLTEFARSSLVDLVAMTTHGRSGWSGLVFGNVAFDVAREVDCPVLLVNSRGAK